MRKWLALFLAALLFCMPGMDALAEGVEWPTEVESEEAENGDVEVDVGEQSLFEEDVDSLSDGALSLGDVVLLPEEDCAAEEMPETYLGEAGSDDAERIADDLPESGEEHAESDADAPDADGDAEEAGWRYARVADSAAEVLVEEDSGEALTELHADDILLIVASGELRLRVAFDTANGVLEGWVSPESVEVMESADTDAFLDILVSQGEVTAYQGNLNYLLPRLECVLPGNDVPEAPVLSAAAADGDEAEEAADTEGTTDASASDEAEDGSGSGDAVPGKEPANDEEPSDIETKEASADEIVRNEAVLPSGVALNASKGTIGVGEIYSGLAATLRPEGTASTLTWKSSNDKVLTVNALTGKLKGLKAGSATVTVCTANGKTATCKVTVAPAPTSVTVTPKTVTLWEGQSKQLKPAVNSGSACAKYTYTSGKSGVAAVGAGGKIMARKKGSATITVKTYNNRSATVKVTVKALPQSVVFGSTEADLYPGRTLQLSATAYEGPNGTGSASTSTVTFSIVEDGEEAGYDPGCVTLTAAGKVTAVREGVVRVRATAHNDVQSEEDCVVRVLPEAEQIELNETEITIGVGEVYRQLGYASPDGTAASAIWSATNAKIAKVNASTGAVTGVKKGVAAVVATPHRGESVRCAVTVVPAPTKVVLSPESQWTDTREPVQIHASVNEGSVSNAFSFAYADSASRSVVSLDAASGVVTPLRSGTAKISVKAYNGVSRVFTLKVDLPVTDVIIDNAEKVSGIYEFQSIAVQAYALDAFGGRPDVPLSYSAEDETGSVSVSDAGMVTGVCEGAARLTVAAGECAMSVDISVRKGAKKVALSPERKVIGVGETLALNPVLTDRSGEVMGDAYTVSTTTAGKKIVTCFANGTVKAKKAGKAVVTVKHANGRYAKVTITVKNKPWAVKISPAKATLGLGQSKTLKALLPSGTASRCTFKSSKTSVATVNAATGKVTAVGTGKATITVRTHNGKTATAKITVTRAPRYIALKTGRMLTEVSYASAYRLIINRGATFQLQGSVEYGARGSISGYASDNGAVATVSRKGLVAAVAPGTANITVTATGGAETQVQVYVYGAGAAPGRSLEFVERELTVAVGEMAVVPALLASGLTDSERLNANVSSADTSIASVYRDGNSMLWSVQGKAEGDTLISARVQYGSATDESIAAALTLHVVPAGAQTTQPEDSGIHFDTRQVEITEDESIIPKVRDASGAAVGEGEGAPELALTSGDEEIASVGEDGRTITGVSAGTTLIRASCGNGVAYMKVIVRPKQVSLVLDALSRSMFVGERFRLGVTTNAARVNFACDDEDILGVSETGYVTAKACGVANVTVVADGTSESCVVTVQRHISKVAISPAVTTGARVGDRVTLTAAVGGADEVGTVTFSVNNESCAEISGAAVVPVSDGKANCVVSLKEAGAVLVTATTDNGYSAVASISIVDRDAVTYRLFTACGYAMPAYSGPGKLPFPLHNTQSVRKILGGCGLGYAKNTNLVNPTRAMLGSGMKSFFKKADSNDVTVVYLCSHGHATAKDKKSGYYMSLPMVTESGVTFEKVTSGEIMKALRACKGRVILFLDSCYSGAFITDQKAALDAEGGRISVITAATFTSASYYNVPDTSKAMDFLTLFLMLGLGYDSISNSYIKDSKRNKGSAPGYMLADSYEDYSLKDGVVTLREMYSFADKSLKANLAAYSKQSWYWGPGPAQKIRTYLGANANLPLYKPKN